MEIRILGPLEVVEDGRAIAIASPLQRALLALLILPAGRPVSTESIHPRLVPDIEMARPTGVGDERVRR